VERNTVLEENAVLRDLLKVLFSEIGSRLIVWQVGRRLQGVL
jgi:hypothetical protein